MKSYYVSKTTTSGFVGTFTFDQIESMLKADVIKPDYVATESSGPSFNQLVESGSATWVPVSKLQPPNDPPTAGTANLEPVAGQQLERSKDSGCAVVSASALLGISIGGMGGLIYLTYLVSNSNKHPWANFLGVLTIGALLWGGFVTIVSAILGALIGAVAGSLFCVFRGKRSPAAQASQQKRELPPPL